MRAGRVAASAVAGGLLSMSFMAPAYAHYTYQYHGSDFASVNGGHDGISVCDLESDGHGVHVRYRIGGDDGISVLHDHNGADNGCATQYLGAGQKITTFQLCEHVVGCRPWKDT
jgi:hypothetical protein